MSTTNEGSKNMKNMKKTKDIIKTAIIIIGALIILGVPVAAILNATWSFITLAVKLFFLVEAAKLVNGVVLKMLRPNVFGKFRRKVSDRMWEMRQQYMTR